MKGIPQENNDIPDNLISYKSIIPSFSQLLNIYNGYKLSGFKTAAVITATSSLDNVLTKKYGFNKSYVSLGTFWGFNIYNATKQIYSTDKIPAKYKPALTLLFAGFGTSMIFFGNDFFKSNLNLKKTIESIKITASFFDTEKVILKTEEKFSESYAAGIKYASLNLFSLLSNKFIMYSLATQVIKISNIILLNKFFSFAPTDKLSLLLNVKEGKTYEELVKLIITANMSSILELIDTNLSSLLKVSLEKEINMQVAKLVLNTENTSTIMKLGEKVNNIPNHIASVYATASSDIESILKKILLPYIVPTSNSNQVKLEILTKNSINLLFEDFIPTIKFIIDNLHQYTLSKLNSTTQSAVHTDPYSEQVTTKFGQCNLTTTITPANYTYQNVQSIAKLGANKFMLSKLLEYIKAGDNTANNIPNSSQVICILEKMLSNLTHILQFKVLDIKSEEIINTERDLCAINNIIGINNYFSPIDESEKMLEELKSTLLELKELKSHGAKRLLNNSLSLKIENYHLKKQNSNNDMLYINELEFKANKVYVVMGPIGTGKTTLLSDIAECLSNVFESTGTIYYPSNNGKNIPKILCGTDSFSPPATTLFERLTYRIPQEYVTSNIEPLTRGVLTLFKTFEVGGFTKENLFEKINNDKLGLSTGQCKIVTLIAAILYKEYLNMPVLFVIDETLANLDKKTSFLVCNKIKEVFGDSIIITVDHQYEYNPIYQEVIDLGSYRPSFNELIDDKASDGNIAVEEINLSGVVYEH